MPEVSYLQSESTTPVQYAIEVDNVTKFYKRRAYTRQFLTLKSALIKGDLFRMLKESEVLTALKNVSFNVPRGTTLGIIGPNGSGKSTLLKLIAGILKPSKGEIRVNGRISALIELGAGFHPELTGRENILINGIMLGLTKQQIRERMDEIIRFAELEEFIDNPVRTYSSGMFMRLGFSVAVHVDPEILLIDEVLAVGDEAFAHKCLERMLSFKKSGKTIILVTHALGMVEEFCDVAIWLKRGEIQKIGDPREVCGLYRLDVARSETKRIKEEEETSETPSPEVQAASAALEEAVADVIDRDPLAPKRWGDQQIVIQSVEILNEEGVPSRSLPSGRPASIRIKIDSRIHTRDFVFGIGIFSADGTHVYGTNTHIDRIMPVNLPAGQHTVTVHIPSLTLLEGLYILDVAVHRLDGYPYDYQRGMHRFRVYNDRPEVGVARIPHRWEFSSTIEVNKNVSSESS